MHCRGTNSIALPATIAEAIYAQIPDAVAISNSGGLFAYPCKTSVHLVLTMGGVNYAILPKDFEGGIVNQAGTLCSGAVASLGNDLSTPWIVGTPFRQSKPFSFYLERAVPVWCSHVWTLTDVLLFSRSVPPLFFFPRLYGPETVMGFYNAYRFKPAAIGFATIADPNNVLGTDAIPTSSGNSTTAQASQVVSSASSSSSGTAGTAGAGASGSGTSGASTGGMSLSGVGIALAAVGFAASWVL